MEPLAHLVTPPASAEAAVFLLFAAGVTAMTAFAFVLWVGWMAMKMTFVLVTRLSLWPFGGRQPDAVKTKQRACPTPSAGRSTRNTQATAGIADACCGHARRNRRAIFHP